MARIRTIKPDFWTNEKVMRCNPLTRLLFIGMWNFADDYGRMVFAPMSVKARVFPNDTFSADEIRDMLNELSRNDLLLIYAADGKDYIEITGWDHQKIDKRQISKIPSPFAAQSTVVAPDPTTSPVIPPTPADLPRLPPTPAPVMEGKGREGRDIRAEERERGKSMLTDRSKALADAFLKAVGISSPLQVPLHFSGLDWRALQWEAAGWTPEIITAGGARAGPDKPLEYHEKVFATLFAKQSAPLPKVEIREQDIIHVTASRTNRGGNIVDAAKRRLAQFSSEAGVDHPPDRGVVRLLPKG